MPSHLARPAEQTTATHGLSYRLLIWPNSGLFVLLPQRRLRAVPRAVKRKTINYGVKRAEHRDWPHPAKRPETAIAVLSPQVNGIAASPALAASSISGR